MRGGESSDGLRLGRGAQWCARSERAGRLGRHRARCAGAMVRQNGARGTRNSAGGGNNGSDRKRGGGRRSWRPGHRGDSSGGWRRGCCCCMIVIVSIAVAAWNLESADLESLFDHIERHCEKFGDHTGAEASAALTTHHATKQSQRQKITSCQRLALVVFKFWCDLLHEREWHRVGIHVFRCFCILDRLFECFVGSEL